MVELRMVSEANFSFGITSRALSDVLMNVYVRPISSTVPSTPSTVTRSPSRSGWVKAMTRPETKFASGRLRGEADDEADDGGGREQAGGDRPHLRDDEQRGEDPERDDRGHQAAAQHAVAGRGPGRKLAARHPPVDELREDDRGHDDPDNDQPALPEPHGRSIRREGGRSLATRKADFGAKSAQTRRSLPR